MIKSVEEHHLTHQLSFGTILICYRLGKDRPSKIVFGEAFRKSRAIRSWVGL